MSPRRTELAVGVFVLIGLAVIGSLVVRFSQHQTGPAGGYALTVEVKDATGIRAGVPVRLGGVDIGRVVHSPELSEDSTQLIIPLEIFPTVKIPEHSTGRVGTSGLLGGGYVRILPPEQPSGKFLSEGAKILSEPAEHFSDLASGADRAMVNLSSASSELIRVSGQTGQLIERIEAGLLTDDNLSRLESILKDMAVASGNLRTASEQIIPMLTEANETLTNLGEAANGAKDSFAQIGNGVAQIEAGAADLSKTLAMTRPVVENFDTTIAALKKTLVTTNSLLEEIEKGDGLASSFLRDPELKGNFESFLKKLDRNGILFYPREGGKNSEDKSLFPGTRRQP